MIDRCRRILSTGTLMMTHLVTEVLPKASRENHRLQQARLRRFRQALHSVSCASPSHVTSRTGDSRPREVYGASSHVLLSIRARDSEAEMPWAKISRRRTSRTPRATNYSTLLATLSKLQTFGRQARDAVSRWFLGRRLKCHTHNHNHTSQAALAQATPSRRPGG